MTVKLTLQPSYNHYYYEHPRWVQECVGDGRVGDGSGRGRQWVWSTHSTVSASLLPVAGSMQAGLAVAYSRRQRDSDLRAHSAI